MGVGQLQGEVAHYLAEVAHHLADHSHTQHGEGSK